MDDLLRNFAFHLLVPPDVPSIFRVSLRCANKLADP